MIADYSHIYCLCGCRVFLQMCLQHSLRFSCVFLTTTECLLLETQVKGLFLPLITTVMSTLLKNLQNLFLNILKYINHLCSANLHSTPSPFTFTFTCSMKITSFQPLVA